MRKITIITVSLVMILSIPGGATVIHIPADQPTIQAGIVAAINGDTVLVADGTYYEHINFMGKSIVVSSVNGAESTYIEKLIESTPLVTFSGAPDTTSILNGFTILNATSTGINCDNGSAKIENNTIEYNIKDAYVQSQGGAITIKNSTSPIVIRNNIIRYNNGDGGWGYKVGGIFAENADLLIIDSNIIYENIGYSVAGVYTINSCTQSKFNLIYKNNSFTIGGMYYQFAKNNSSIINNTIVNNLSSNYIVGGIYLRSGTGYTVVKNNIVAFNQRVGIYGRDVSDVHVSYNCVHGNESGNILGISPEIGNIYIDPQFFDWANDDLYLRPVSPCIDTGDPSSPLDPDGTRADRGALYFAPVTGYGDLSGEIKDILDNLISGAIVSIDSLGLNYTTGLDGLYFFNDLDAPWRYNLSVSHDSFIDTSLNDVFVILDETTYVDIVLDAESIISGVVTNSDTDPIEGVVVQVQEYAGIADTTNSAGEYFIDWIINGTYDVSFSHPLYADYLAEDIVALPNETTEFNIVLGPTGSISGTVTNSTLEAISGVEVTLPGYPDIADTTDVSGEFIIEYLDPGTYEVFFSHPMYADTIVSEVEVISGITTELNVSLIGSGTLYGVVTDTALSPIDYVLVTVEDAIPDRSTYTNINGEYEILDITPGTHEVTFSVDNYIDTTVSGVVITENCTTELNVVLGQTYYYLPGDVNMAGGTWPPAATGPDVTYLVGYFRGPGRNPCKFEGDLGLFWASADANGDCNIIGSDVTKMVGVFRGIGSMLYCGDDETDPASYIPAWLSPFDLPAEAPPGWPNCE